MIRRHKLMNGVSDTSFANETHQLLVSISRHLYVTKSGVVKYQENHDGGHR